MKVTDIKNIKELKTAVKLWNERHSNFILRQGLIQQNILSPYSKLNVKLLGLYRSENLEGLEGVAVCKWLSEPVADYASSKEGWISLFTAPPEGRLKLWQYLRDFLVDRGVDIINYGGDPQNFFPGLPVGFMEERHFWRQTGFTEDDRVYDLRRIYPESFREDEFLTGYSLDKFEQGFWVERCSEENRTLLLKFLQQEFPGRWYYEAENISRRAGGLQDYWLLKRKTKGVNGSKDENGSGNVVGFARTNRCDGLYQGPNLNWGGVSGLPFAGLGPLGLANRVRGQGLSLPFIAEILQKLLHQGYREITIDWTDLVDYYGKLGFEVCREYLPLSSEL